ncbi:MAG: hypothetical protein V8Q91_00200 [Bilophila wadsworthia]
MSLDSLDAILKGLESHFSLGFVAFIPPLLMIVLAYRRFPVLPVMLVCLLSAVAIALFEGVGLNSLAKMMTSGYVSQTGIKQSSIPSFSRRAHEHHAHGAPPVFRDGLRGNSRALTGT